MMTRRQTLKTITAGASSLLLPNAGWSSGIDVQRNSGYRQPHEADPHERTFMQWPSSTDIYGSGKALARVQDKIALIANSISTFEPVVMLARPEDHSRAGEHLGKNVELWNIETQDLWCRDSGPTFVVNSAGDMAISSFNFNGWGNKQDHQDDSRIAARVAEKLGMPMFNNGIVGEAGGVEFDGQDTAIAHESSWINKNRNKGSKADVERLLLEALGAKKMIWAPGIAGADITDYHIDALARYIKPGLVLLQLPERMDPNDPWSISAFETYEILKQSRDAAGQKLDIVVVPEPKDIRSKKRDFVASYVNYYVCNGGIISAEFGDDTADEAAYALLTQLYPERKVVSLNVDAIGEAGGGIHCATQQQPKMKV